MVRKSVVYLLVLLAVSISGYSATVQTYSSSSAFSDALASLPSIVDFNSLAYQSFNPSYTFAGVTFTNVGGSSDPAALATQKSPGSQYWDWGTGTVLALPPEAGSYVSIVLPGPATAFALNFMTIFNTGGSLKISFPELDATQYTIAALATHNPAWSGFISDTPFTNIRIYQNSGRGIIDNITYGLAAPGTDPGSDTPEIATALMTGAGLIALRFARRRLSGTPA
jgi:hypothetical protein